MKITVHTENEPKGIEVDWPIVPGTGDFVSWHYGHGTEKFKVDHVEYEVEGEAQLTHITIHLAL